MILTEETAKEYVMSRMMEIKESSDESSTESVRYRNKRRLYLHLSP